MPENEIKEFVSKIIKQTKEGLPEGYVLEGKFDFDISVITKKEKRGEFGISLVGVGLQANNQQLHRVRFSIVDPKAQKNNAMQAIEILRQFILDMIIADQQMKNHPKTLNPPKN